jgi:hypothetical protein
MPAKKIRVELFDEDGNRYSISFEGQITREKALRLLDLVELLGGASSSGGSASSGPVSGSVEMSKFDKVRALVLKRFPLVWFSSREVQSAFEQELSEPISLSTVATYLSRMGTRGLVLKSGPPNSLRYRVVTGLPQSILRQQVP